MIKEGLFEIGDNRVVYYQQFLIIVSLILLFLFTALAITTQNFYYKLMPFLIALIFVFIIFLYSKIYYAKYDSKFFYISNLFNKKRICTSDFIEIKRVRYFEYFLKIVFREKSFFLLVKSDDFFKDLFISRARFSEDLTKRIKSDIETLASKAL